MFNDEIDLEGAKLSTTEIPVLYRSYVIAALQAESAEEITSIALSLTGEQRPSGFIMALAASNSSRGSLWSYVLNEVYDFFCLKTATYRSERVEGANTFQALVHVIATTIGSTVNIGLGILSGLVSIALILVAKIGRNAWCKQYAHGREPTK